MQNDYERNFAHLNKLIQKVNPGFVVTGFTPDGILTFQYKHRFLQMSEVMEICRLFECELSRVSLETIPLTRTIDLWITLGGVDDIDLKYEVELKDCVWPWER